MPPKALWSGVTCYRGNKKLPPVYKSQFWGKEKKVNVTYRNKKNKTKKK